MTRRRSLLALCFTLTWLAGCGDDPVTDEPDAAASDATPSDVAPDRSDALPPDGPASEGLRTLSLEQHGITWTFAEPVEYGQFVNGDYWVVDPGDGAALVAIDPGHALHPETGRHMNGSMLNPATGTQGYDEYQNYDPELNVAIDISPENPLKISGDNSLVSTISNLEPGGTEHTSYVNTAAVLTVLSSVPPDGSFRPGISAPAKKLHSSDSLDRSLLAQLSYPESKPDIEAQAAFHQMVWLTHNGSWTGRYMRPSASGLSNYYYPGTFSSSALMLHLDYTPEEKEPLLINFVQLGIDIHSYLEAGGKGWPPDGGHSSGRKWPILFAGLLLDDASMKNIGQVSGDYLHSEGYGPGNAPEDYLHFGEDGQTLYVTQSLVDLTNGPSWDPDTRNEGHAPYTAEMIGMPEWAIRYSTHPSKSDASWTATYRTIGSGARAWAGTVLAARIMGAVSLWNYDAHFDYVDRYMAISNGDPDPFGYEVPDEQEGSRPGGLVGLMWDTYRASYP